MPAKSPEPDGDALWQRVIETVKPLKGRAITRRAAMQAGVAPPILPTVPPQPRKAATRSKPASGGPGNTLDGGWDKRLRRGIVAPDMTIDLHGHTLASAHTELEAGLTRALARHARLVLLVTGRPPPPGRSRLDNPLRGIIRASIGDWLHHSRHASRIAAVRNAHPTHGGAGALYIILKRPRD